MKRFLVRVLFFMAVSLGLSVSALAQDTFTVDPNHSYVLWHISHFGYSNPSGKWFANGTIMLDEAKPQNSKVNIVINIAQMDTGIPKLDEHLKSDQFFNAVKFPTATFVSDTVDVTGKNTAKVHGMLTVHGVSKPVILNVTLNKIGVSPITHKNTAGFTANTMLKRSDFGITNYLPGLGDEVKLDIEVEASK